MKKTRRGTCHANSRGSTRNRRARRAYLIEKFGIPRKSDGAKTTLQCFHCPRRLRVTGPWEVDRFPVCGHDGGKYVRSNVVPSCPDCNRTRCASAGAACRGGRGRGTPPNQRWLELWGEAVA